MCKYIYSMCLYVCVCTEYSLKFVNQNITAGQFRKIKTPIQYINTFTFFYSKQ